MAKAFGRNCASNCQGHEQYLPTSAVKKALLNHGFARYSGRMGCGQCQNERLKGHKFCSNCGTKLDAVQKARTAPETERRQITVLFYDLVGSTELSTSVEPEDFREAIANFHSVASSAVRPFDAFVGAHVGDGGIIYFGYPVAREDAAECAILSGLALIEAVSKITLPNGEKAEARVGIATGTSIVGRIEDGDTGNSAAGRVTSLAARLQSYAKANQCVIAETTRRLVGGLFQLDDLGIIEAKGFTDDVQAFGVVARSENDRFHALRGGGSTLIGREAQTAALRKKWDQTLEGIGKTCMVVGEAGVGKSRLVADFVNSLDHSNVVFIPCFCAPHSRQAALRPFISRFRSIAGASDHQSSPSLEALDLRLAPGTSELDRHLICRLIGLDAEAPEEVLAMTSNQLRTATIDAIIHQIDLLSERQPAVVVIEDMHWADPSSRALVEKTLTRGDLGRVLVIMTARPEIEETWEVSSSIDTIALPPFTSDESRELINQVLGAQASASMVDAITERSGGIALFVEELTKAILDSDAHVPGNVADGFELQSTFTLPETLQDSLLARLDQLGEAKRIAQIASVVGREFTKDDLAKVAPDLSPLIERGCDTLLNSGMTVPLSEDAEHFQFRHVLIQEIAYSTLVRGERREYNARLLEALEQDERADNPTDAERWAHYALEADLPARSIHYWLLAGQDAMRVFAMSEAEARLRRGLELINQVGDPRERARLELDLLLTLGKVLLAHVGHANPETGEIFAKARHLAEERGDRTKLLASMHGQQSYDLQLSRIQATQERGAEMLSLGEEFKDDVWRLIGYRSRGIASFPLGNYKQSVDDLLSGIELLGQLGDSIAEEIVADDLIVAMQSYAAMASIYLEENALSTNLYQSATKRANAIRQPYTRAFAAVGRNYSRLMQGDFDGLEQDYLEHIALSEKNDIPYFFFTLKVFLAHYEALRGAPNAAQNLAEAIEGYRLTRSIVYQPTFKHWEGLAWLAQGNLDKAREANVWSIETAVEYGMYHMFGEYYGLKAVLDHKDNKLDDASEAARLARNWTSDQNAVLCSKLNSQLWENYGISDKLPA
ncbi:AAA family ATPase [uncultured Erythrobacter sp.]|uniref:AAA family ATPase n=1 Tax=uncultured Erythrobacter sp. TaxID=263913 RepID=UPI0026387418|nr:AAA family ATPase [uncultured Erythrobacter sp.]